MNNDQFRRLVGASSSQSGSPSNGSSASTASPAGATPSALGSRQRSSIPMTPRSVGGGYSSRNEFARQLAARNNPDQAQKKFRTSAPKGSRLAEGYVDRAKEREAEEEDERAARIKALEELLKKEEIDQETFEKQRDQIAGGDLSSTHLVKGLDRKLLARIRQGEDVYGDGREAPPAEEDALPAEEMEDEFDRIEHLPYRYVHLLRCLSCLARSACAIRLSAEMKAARLRRRRRPKEASLGDRFKKIGARQKAGTRIERDNKGREVMIIVDEDGHEKRKVRKVQRDFEEDERQRELMRPDRDAKPLGMEVPEIYQKQPEPAEEEDDDIFADAGDDYDPLAGMDSDSDSDEDEDHKHKDKTAGEEEAQAKDEKAAAKQAMPPPPRPKQAEAKDYFKGSKTELLSAQTRKAPSMSDPDIQAAFKRAAQLGAAAKDRKGDDDDNDMADEEARRRAEKHKKMLESSNRDDADIDMGFGTSRFEDEEDFDDTKVKLSEWGHDDDEGEGKGGKGKRKRGPKKRKGDANNAADVLRVMEQRKAAGA
ncbi:uncharacterized protein VDAG_04166 [Verticillium dahliae VdLs.17]|uniref:RED-like N-terminal domain-containing protein n=1 Tax=Verticillium dahliae (strain VdLs.17 / ATCC MYA-4575 / FGSC 10137) TaxID=498257 RepID=G2X2X2_VERDV|nr:uncharacterized protein VDAG_04166 [Verticillium dahliae VdLs.17]EGY22728.1 hypothetical protein VDAG_04166 [Verticillium dahliae VdLs.17]